MAWPNQDPRALSMLTQPSTLYGGNAPLRMGMLDLQGVPGLQGGLGGMISMALQPLLMQMTQNAGFAGLQFGGQQNLYDRMMAQDFFLQSREAVREASRRDEEHYYQRILGVSRLTGTVVGPEQERVARTMAGDISRMGVYLGDVFPETFDEMHGIRGSAAMMARRIHLGGRYALDPITGEVGLRGETAGAISSQVYENLFGPAADLGTMRGFGAGRVGQLYDELQRRGFMGGAVSRDTAFLRAFGAEGTTDVRSLAQSLVRDPNRHIGITAQEFQQLEAREPGQGVQRVMESPEVRGIVTTAEARRISDRLRNMVGAVSAMRDIFGDIGRPDAPMAELINGLQALTQGGLATMNPQQLEMMVRRTQQLSQISGISMEGMMQLMSRGAGMADQMGLDRRFAVLATQGAAAFGSGFSMVDPATPGWRMPDKDTMTSIDQSLRLTAARSDQANQLNATMRIRDEIIARRPGFDAEHPRNQFEALARAIQNNQTQYTWGGQQQNVAIPMQRWLELASDADIQRETAFRLRTDAFANQEYGARYDTGNLVRFMQRQVEVDPFLRVQAEQGLQNVGGTREQRQTMAGRLVDVIRGTDIQGRPIPGGMTPTQLRDPTQRFDMMVRALRQEADRMGMHVTDDVLRQAAVSVWSGTEEQMQRMPSMQGYQGLLGLLTASSPTYLLAGDAQRRRVEDRAQIASALSGLGRGGMLRNFMDVLESSDLNRPIGQIIGEIAGGVPREAFGAAMMDFNRMHQEYRGIRPDSPAHRDARADLERRMQELATRSGLGNMNRAQLYSSMFRIGEMRRQYDQLSGRLADPNTSPQERTRITEQRQGLLNQIQSVATEARQQADALGENVTDIDPVHTRLTTALSGTTDPRELGSMIETFDRIRDRLRGQTVHGQAIRSEADVERVLTDRGARADLIKQLGGEDDLKKIDQVIKVLRGEHITDNRIGSEDRPAVAKLEGPLRIEGSVEIVGNRIVARDMVTGNHRNPVIQDEGGLI